MPSAAVQMVLSQSRSRLRSFRKWDVGQQSDRRHHSRLCRTIPWLSKAVCSVNIIRRLGHTYANARPNASCRS